MYNAYLSIKATLCSGYSHKFVSNFAISLGTRGYHREGSLLVLYFVEGCIVLVEDNVQIFYGVPHEHL